MITYHTGMKHGSLATSGMGRWTGRILPVLCVLLLAIGAVHSKEDSKEPAEGKGESTKREDPPKTAPKLISMDRAIEQAEKRHKARVVRRDKGESGGRPVYKFRLLSDDDRVWTIVVDAETGKELK